MFFFLAAFLLFALAFGLLFFVFVVVVAVALGLFGHVELYEHFTNNTRKGALIINMIFKTVETRAGLCFNEGTPQIDKLLRGRWRRRTRQSLTHHHRQRFFNRRIRNISDLIEIATMIFVIKHCGEIGGHAFHTARAN